MTVIHVDVKGKPWVRVTKTSRPPEDYYETCWAYHKHLGVIPARGHEPDWKNGDYTHWMPGTRQNTFNRFVVFNERPEPPSDIPPPVPPKAGHCKHCGHPIDD